MIAIHILGAFCLLFTLALLLSILFGLFTDATDEWLYVKESSLSQETVDRAKYRVNLAALYLLLASAGIVWLVCVLLVSIRSGALT